MTERSIHTLYWGIVPHDCAPAWGTPTGTLIGVWPGPFNHDQCFAEAGFTDFGDPDEAWDREWEQIARRLLAHLERYGTPRLRNPGDVEASRRRSLLDRMLRPKPAREFVEQPINERVLLSTEDDRLPDAVVDFGEPAKVTLRTGFGHTVFWLAVTAGVAFDGETLLQELAEGRRVVPMDLDWRYVVGGKSP